MDTKLAVQQRLHQALWQLGRELATLNMGLPDVTFMVSIKNGATTIEELGFPLHPKLPKNAPASKVLAED